MDRINIDHGKKQPLMASIKYTNGILYRRAKLKSKIVLNGIHHIVNQVLDLIVVLGILFVEIKSLFYFLDVNYS
jgi:tetrahydromethanopterin S-methyltransferase subunit F